MTILVLNLFIGLMATVATKTIRPEWCHFLADPGPCHKNLQVFAYDIGIDRCVEFTYGGCGGNPNRFYSKQSCREICNAPLDYEDELISTERSHITHKTLKALTTTAQQSMIPNEAVGEGTPEGTESGTQAKEQSTNSSKETTVKSVPEETSSVTQAMEQTTDSTKEFTDKSKAFTLFNILQFKPKELICK